MAQTRSKVPNTSTTVRSGTDGRYRMVIEDRYQHLAKFRKLANMLVPFWFVCLTSKCVWSAAPFSVTADQLNPVLPPIFAGALAVSILSWFLAGFGGNNERFALVMLFNTLTICLLALHCLTRFQYYSRPDEQKLLVNEPKLVALALVRAVPALRPHAAFVLSIMGYAEGIIDGLLLAIGAPLGMGLHMYITEKKGVRRETAEHGAAKKTR